MLEGIVQSTVPVHENIRILPLDFILLKGSVSLAAFLFDQHPSLFWDYEGVKLQAWIRALCSTNTPTWTQSFHGFLPKFCISNSWELKFLPSPCERPEEREETP